MSDAPRTQPVVDLARRWAHREVPLGGPWWAYAVAIGSANVARQLVMPSDVDSWIQISTFIALVVVMSALVALVNSIVVGHRQTVPVRVGAQPRNGAGSK